VIGTLNLLEAVEKYSPSTPTLVITTDKVYTPSSASEALTEVAPLGGGTDPYSASKAMADILSASWSKSNPESKLAIARAGNVIGGGDDSSGRLIPDIINAYLAGVEPVLRHPHSVRPWQHVLDCLSGYLTLMDAIQAQGAAGAWNFGPNSEDNRTVLDVVQEVAKSLEVEPRWAQDQGKYMPETSFLALDSSKARSQLRWEPRWSFEDSIKKTSEWERNVALGKSPFEVTNLQVMDFLFDR
jgi:CDP-glucose 4,6-dehydratase